jgi:hypothetical protein
MTNGTRRGWGVSVTPRPLFFPGKDTVPIVQEARYQGRSWQVRKISPPPGFDPRTVQPVASRYTDWATRPTMDWYIYEFVCASRWSYNKSSSLCNFLFLSSSSHFSLHRRHPSYVQTVAFHSLITDKDKVQGVSFIAALSKAVLLDTMPPSTQTWYDIFNCNWVATRWQ